jgi:hemerythrin-like domain-containing protein
MKEVSRALDDEHRATLDLLGRAGQAFARAPRPGTPEATEAARAAASLAQFIEEHIARHFGFEEQVLFPRLADAGEGDLADLLAEEHVTIRAVAGELLPLARGAAAGTLDDAGFAALKRGAPELAERLGAHIQKETMSLLPSLDDLLDDDTDREIAFAYMSS